METTQAEMFRRKATAEMRRLTGAGILVAATGEQFGVNQVGVRIWDLLEESRSLAALVEILLGDFDIPAARCREEANIGFWEGIFTINVSEADGAKDSIVCQQWHKYG